MLLKNKYFRVILLLMAVAILNVKFNISFLNEILLGILATCLLLMFSELILKNKKIRDYSLLQKILIFIVVFFLFLSVFSFVINRN